MNAKKYCIGVDLGGTNIAVGLVDIVSESIVGKNSVKTNAPRSCEAITRDIIDVCEYLCREEGITLSDTEWIGVATPGIVKDDVVLAAFNLGWENAPFGDIIREMSKRPAYVANDANAAAYAEAVWGAGKGRNSLVAFTIGTGVGGGVVIGGKIWEGINGFAAELGHMIHEPGGRLCGCGKRGCIEAYCSASALVRDTKAQMELDKDSLMWQEVSGDIDNVSGKTAFRAADLGDVSAKLVIDNFTDALSTAVSNLVNILQPDVVCIGGGISREGEKLLAPLREKVRAKSFGTDSASCEIVAATFANDAGIIGAALLGLQNK
jgi:glucokinase